MYNTDQTFNKWIIYGSGTKGDKSGRLENAEFNEPNSICINHITGDIYVTDNYNHKIKKIDLKGYISTFAGSGLDGYRDSPDKLSANFKYPYSITIDHSNCNKYNYNDDDLVFYVGDRCSIKKISKEGVETIAGDSEEGYADGEPFQSRFSYVTGIGIDNQCNIIAADFSNHRIRKIQQGKVTTIAGEGVRSTEKERFYNPWAVIVDEENNIIVSDSHHHRIKKIAVNGTVSTLAGGACGFRDGTGIEASFDNPRQISFDRHYNIWVCDTDNNRIRKIDKMCQVSTIKFNLLLSAPRGVAVRRNGNVIIADTYNNRVIELISDSYWSSNWPMIHLQMPALTQIQIKELLLSLYVASPALPKDLRILIVKHFLVFVG